MNEAPWILVVALCAQTARADRPHEQWRGPDSQKCAVINCNVPAPNSPAPASDPAAANDARYDKLHMFDAVLPNGREIRESSTYRPGTTAVAAPTPWGPLGITVCYDLRFPQLYRTLAHAGCRMLAVPSAFTQATGELHWHALLRARAIENAAYVLAPATCGTHPGSHGTYGHSLVAAPSGEIVAEAGVEPCVILADLALADADRARAAIPALAHDRPYELGDGAGGRPHATAAAST